MELENPSGDIEAALAAGIHMGSQTLRDINGVPVIVHPKDFNVATLEKLMLAPSRTEQHVVCDTATSFLDYFNHFANDNSAIFCDLAAETFTGVIDYHAVKNAAWKGHTVTFKCRRTDEASAWINHSGKKMEQQDFAYFIEANALEVVNPPAAEMLQIATYLKAEKKVNFISGTVLANGQQSLTYMEEINGSAGEKGELRIPDIIKLGMRMFQGGDAYELEARFRYRINSGKLVMWYDLIRPNNTLRAAVQDAYAVIKAGIKTQLFIHGSLGSDKR